MNSTFFELRLMASTTASAFGYSRRLLRAALVAIPALLCMSATAHAQFNSNVQFWTVPSPNDSARVVSVFRDGNLATTGGYAGGDQLFVLNRFQGSTTYQFPESDARVSIWAPPSAPDIIIGGFQGRQGLYENGTQVWDYTPVGCCNLPHDPFAIDPTVQRAYFAANFVAYEMDPNTGNFLSWVYFPSGGDFTGYLSLADSTHLYQAGSNVNGTGGHVSLLNPAGSGLWNVLIEPGIGSGPYNELQPPAVARDGSIVVTSAGTHYGVNPITPGRLARIQQDGTIVFNTLINAITPPVIGGNGFVLVGTQAPPVLPTGPGQVQAYGLDGSLKWSTSVNGQPNDLLVGDDGLVYVGIGSLSQGQIIGLDQNDGDVKFTATVPGAWEIILYGGVIYASGSNVTAVPVTASGYDPRSPWPVRLHDNQRTSSATAPFYNTALTTTTLSSSASLQVSGGSVTLTAMVSTAGSNTPTGSVIFTDNGTALATALLDSTGQANFTPTPLTVGWHIIRAYYSGDGNYSASISPLLRQGIAADNDTGGTGGTIDGNETVNGRLTATSFSGDGSALTNVTAANSNFATSAATAANALSLGGLSAGSYARLDIGNVFNGNQTFAGSVAANGGIFGQGVCSGGSCTPGVKGQGYFGLYGQGDVYGVFATSAGGPGVHAESSSDAGVFGSGVYGILGTTSSANGSAGIFNAYNSAKILSGQSTNVEVFSVDTKGKLTSAYLAVPPTGTASGTTTGFNSGSLDLTASVYNGSSSIPETFRWQVEPMNAGSGAVSATMNLLFGSTGTPSETGFSIKPDGTITFAAGQTFPGTGGGTITGVAAGPGLSGGGTSGNVGLSIPSAGVTNSMLANPSFTVTAGAGLTGGGSVPLGGATSVAIAPNTCTAGSAVTAHPFTCSPFAGLGTNTFNGTQIMPGLTVSGSAIFGSPSYNGYSVNASSNSLAAVAGSSTYGSGIYGLSSSNVAVLGTNGGSSGSGGNFYSLGGEIGVEGTTTSPVGYGVYGLGTSGVGVYGVTSGTTATVAAGVFNNSGSTNAGNILLGQYNGTNEFTVDAKGDVTARGSVSTGGSMTIGTGGTPILEHLSQTFTVNVPAVTPGNCVTLPGLTLSGASDGDSIALGIKSALITGSAGYVLDYFGWVSTANTITLRVCNLRGPTNTVSTGPIRVDIWKH